MELWSISRVWPTTRHSVIAVSHKADTLNARGVVVDSRGEGTGRTVESHGEFVLENGVRQ